MAKNTKTQNTDTAEMDKVLGEHACECSFYEIELSDDAETMTYEGTGCVQTTTRTFAPGHDAKLKALLIKAGAANKSVRRDQGGVSAIDDAQGWAAKFDFGHMVLAGIARAGQKLAAKLDKKQARELARAAAKAAKPAKKTRTPKALLQTYKATIKVGRWTYEAIIDPMSNEATFTSANGETKTAVSGKYSIVTK